MAFKMVKYRLQTLILVDLLARAMGAGSSSAFARVVSPRPGGVTSGSRVESASGRRRVRNNCEDWRYVLEMCDDDDWRDAAVEEPSEDIDEDSIWELKLSDTGTEPVELMAAVWESLRLVLSMATVSV
jgi:hypothetical protein